jgi:hypothetical protein
MLRIKLLLLFTYIGLCKIDRYASNLFTDEHAILCPSPRRAALGTGLIRIHTWLDASKTKSVWDYNPELCSCKTHSNLKPLDAVYVRLFYCSLYTAIILLMLIRFSISPFSSLHLYNLQTV